MDNEKLWNLIGEAWRAIGPHFWPLVEKLCAKSGVNIPTWGLVLAADSFEPDTTTATRLHVRGPYTSSQRYLERLATAADQGFLEELAPGEYRLTQAGRTWVRHSVEDARAAMAQANPLPPAYGERLARLVARLVTASVETPPPPDTWSVRLSLKLMPSIDPPLPYIEQAFSCLGAYRDDAHLAAWQPSGLNATALEALTFLWRGDADSLDTLCEKLALRGHPRKTYAEALAELQGRGFVEGPDSALQVTDAGREFRDQVEADTDRYFYAPWDCLEDAERAELADLLTRLKDGLKAI